MVRPERRTKADLLAAAIIAVVITVAAALIWWVSDARQTSSRPATVPIPNPTPAGEAPVALTQLWSAPSPATRQPVLVGGTVVTGAGHEVTGRDPQTGEPLWSYARDTELCGVSWVYRYAVGVYPDRRGCGQVSTVDASTGQRGPARSSYADKQVSLSSDGTTVLSAGRTRLELWRSDLVRTLSYGEIDARVKPSARGVGAGCTLTSAAASSAAVSVLEACPGRSDLRLTLLRPSKDEDEPELREVPLPGVAVDSGARVLAVADTDTAVYLPAPQPRVEVIDETGTMVASTPLPKPPAAAALAAGPAVSRPGDVITWWTGEAVLVFDTANLTYRYTVGPTGATIPLGPATLMAGRLLIPVTGGVGIYDLATGDYQRTIPVSRPPGPGPVIPKVLGTTVLEQRGDTVAALG